MVLINDIDLIGDFLGTVPATIALAKNHGDLSVVPSANVIELHHFYADHHNIKLKSESSHFDFRFDLHGAFAYAATNNLHMTQAHFNFVGLSTPSNPIRPDIIFPDVDVPKYDVVFAPYSKSLPPHEKWWNHCWIDLARELKDYKIGVLGSAIDPKFIFEPNVENYFGNPLLNMFNVIKKTKCVVSVVSGPSHVCYAVGTPNVLLDSQGAWGVNPDAKRIHGAVGNVPAWQPAELVRNVLNFS